MNSLFNISLEYLSLMRQIEDNEGDLTPELELALKINEEDAEKKIKAYHGIIKSNESEINLIKDEKARLDKLAKTKENTIKKLKDRVLDACNLFGYTGKSGNKKIDYDTLKVYTVDRDSIEVDEDKFIESSFHAIKNYVEYENALEYNVNLKLSLSQYRHLLSAISSPTPNEFELKIINSMSISINKDKIKSVIEQEIEVPGCKQITKSHVQFR